MGGREGGFLGGWHLLGLFYLGGGGGGPGKEVTRLGSRSGSKEVLRSHGNKNKLGKHLKTGRNCDSWLRMFPEALCIRSDI